ADFVVGGVAANFIFVTEDGTINAWFGDSSKPAVIVVNNSGKAVYKGVTLAEWNGKHYLYATNFQSGKVEVYDSTFTAGKMDRKACELRGDQNAGRDHGEQDNPL